MPIRAAILDSGDVLMRPVTGRWFPHPAVQSILDAAHPGWPRQRLDEALDRTYGWLASVHEIPVRTEDEEWMLWAEYHRRLLDALGLTGVSEATTGRLADAQIREPHVELEPWTLDVLHELRRRGIPVVVLSNAWPSLRRYVRALGIDDLVDRLIISAEVGMLKPDPRFFALAIEATGTAPADTIFVDDGADAVRAAAALGLRALHLRQPERYPDEAHVADLDQIDDLREILGLPD